MLNAIEREEKQRAAIAARVQLPAPRSILKQGHPFNPLARLGAIQERCNRCQNTVYPLDRVFLGRTLIYHKQCLTCRTCDVKLNLQNFQTFKENEYVEVFCHRHLPRFPGDNTGEEYLGEVGIREAIRVYSTGDHRYNSAANLNQASTHNRKLRRFLDKRNSYYQHIGKSLSNIHRSSKSEGCPSLCPTPNELDSLSQLSFDESVSIDTFATPRGPQLPFQSLLPGVPPLHPGHPYILRQHLRAFPSSHSVIGIVSTSDRVIHADIISTCRHPTFSDTVSVVTLSDHDSDETVDNDSKSDNQSTSQLNDSLETNSENQIDPLNMKKRTSAEPPIMKKVVGNLNSARKTHASVNLLYTEDSNSNNTHSSDTTTTTDSDTDSEGSGEMISPPPEFSSVKVPDSDQYTLDTSLLPPPPPELLEIPLPPLDLLPNSPITDLDDVPQLNAVTNSTDSRQIHVLDSPLSPSICRQQQLAEMRKNFYSNYPQSSTISSTPALSTTSDLNHNSVSPEPFTTLTTKLERVTNSLSKEEIERKLPSLDELKRASMEALPHMINNNNTSVSTLATTGNVPKFPASKSIKTDPVIAYKNIFHSAHEQLPKLYISKMPMHSRRHQYQIRTDDLTIVRPAGSIRSHPQSPMHLSEGSDISDFERNISEEPQINTHKASRLSSSSDSESDSSAEGSMSESEDFNCDNGYANDHLIFTNPAPVSGDVVDFKTSETLSISSISELQSFSREHQSKGDSPEIPNLPVRVNLPSKQDTKPTKRRIGTPSRINPSFGCKLPVIFERSASIERAAELSYAEHSSESDNSSESDGDNNSLHKQPIKSHNRVPDVTQVTKPCDLNFIDRGKNDNKLSLNTCIESNATHTNAGIQPSSIIQSGDSLTDFKNSSTVLNHSHSTISDAIEYIPSQCEPPSDYTFSAESAIPFIPPCDTVQAIDSTKSLSISVADTMEHKSYHNAKFTSGDNCRGSDRKSTATISQPDFTGIYNSERQNGSKFGVNRKEIRRSYTVPDRPELPPKKGQSLRTTQEDQQPNNKQQITPHDSTNSISERKQRGRYGRSYSTDSVTQETQSKNTLTPSVSIVETSLSIPHFNSQSSYHETDIDDPILNQVHDSDIMQNPSASNPSKKPVPITPKPNLPPKPGGKPVQDFSNSKLLNSNLVVKLPGFGDLPSNVGQNKDRLQTKPSYNPVNKTPVPSKKAYSDDSETSSASSTTTTSDSESDNEPPPVKNKVQTKSGPPITTNKPSNLTKHVAISDPNIVPVTDLDDLPPPNKYIQPTEFSWKKKTAFKSTTNDVSMKVENETVLKPSSQSNPPTVNQLILPKQKPPENMGMSMIATGDSSISRPGSNPKPILKQEKRPRSPSPSKYVTLSQDTKSFDGVVNNPPDQNSSPSVARKGQRIPPEQTPMRPTNSTTSLNVPGVCQGKTGHYDKVTTPANSRMQYQVKPRSNGIEQKQQPTSTSGQDPQSQDVGDANPEYKEMVDDILQLRQKDQEEIDRETKKKEEERKKRRQEEGHKAVEWEAMRLKSSTQRSNEITDNIMEMDRAIDHVAEDITNIDETLDKMKFFNKTLMNSLEKLSDGEISDVEVGDRQVQTDFDLEASKSKPKPKPKPPSSQKKPRKPSSHSSESLSSDTISDGSDPTVLRIKRGKQQNIKNPDGVTSIPLQLTDLQPHLRHSQIESHFSEESSICEEPERLAMQDKVRRFERKIDRLSGKFKADKPLTDVPPRLNLDMGSSENIGVHTVVDKQGGISKPVPMPRNQSTGESPDDSTLERPAAKSKLNQSYEDIAAAMMENRRRKDKDKSNSKTGPENANPSGSTTSMSSSGTKLSQGQYNDSTLERPSKSRKKTPPDVAPLTREIDDDDFDDDASSLSQQDTKPSGGPMYASRRRYQRGGTIGSSGNFRGSSRAKSVEMLASLEGDNGSRRSMGSRASSFSRDDMSNSDSDQELQDAYAQILGRQGHRSHGNDPDSKYSGQRSRSFNYLEDLDESTDDLRLRDDGFDSQLGLSSSYGGYQNFQRAYRGGVNQRLRASNASSMRSIPDLRGKETLELARLLQGYIDSGREEKVNGMFRLLMREDRGRVDDLLGRFNDDLRAILEAKAREIGLSSEDADSVFNMAYSLTDLHNNLLPGVNSLEHGNTIGGSSRQRPYGSHMGLGGGLADLGLGTGTIHRILTQRPGAEEGPPPAMRPPPKPGPQALSKSAVLTSDYKEIDEATIEVSNMDICTFTDLVAELTHGCNTDIERVRALFRWVTVIDYTVLDFDPTASPESLLGMMRGVKYGQTTNNELFHKLCRFAGISCVFIAGYSKGAGYRPGMNLKDNRMFRNVWTAVFVAGSWRFVNCNWGARYLSTVAGSRGGHTKTGTISSIGEVQYLNQAQVKCRCDEFYFLTDADEHIFEHLPDNKRWQLLRKPISLDQFMRLPILKSPFFNNRLALKKKYAETLTTKAGSVDIKLSMPHFVGISCQLENRADMSVLRGLTLVRVVDDLVVVTASPAQPGKYYLNLFVSEDWKDESVRELACSFQINCSEHNYDRLVVGRYPEVGFLGRTPAAQRYNMALNDRKDPYIVWNEKEVLKIPVTVSPGLKVCHQMKSFDRPGQHSADCDNYAMLQTKAKKAFYSVRFPVDAFYYITVYAAKENTEDDEQDAEQLDCVYRLLVDARKGIDRVLPYPRQTLRWNGCYLVEPSVQHLELNKRYTFRLDAPGYAAISVVINGKTWVDLTPEKSGTGSTWSKKVNVGDELGELSIYAKPACEEAANYIKLLDYALVQRMAK